MAQLAVRGVLGQQRLPVHPGGQTDMASNLVKFLKKGRERKRKAVREKE